MAWWDINVKGEDKCQLLNSPVGDGDSYDSTGVVPFAPTERATGNNLGVYFLEASTKYTQQMIMRMAHRVCLCGRPACACLIWLCLTCNRVVGMSDCCIFPICLLYSD